MKRASTLLLAHMNALDKVPARYIMIRMVLKTFYFSSGSQSLQHSNVLLGNLLIRLFIMVAKYQNFMGSLARNNSKTRNFGLTHTVMYIQGKHIFSESLTLDPRYEKKIVCFKLYKDFQRLRHSPFKHGPQFHICSLRGISSYTAT